MQLAGISIGVVEQGARHDWESERERDGPAHTRRVKAEASLAGCGPRADGTESAAGRRHWRACVAGPLALLHVL